MNSKAVIAFYTQNKEDVLLLNSILEEFNLKNSVELVATSENAYLYLKNTAEKIGLFLIDWNSADRDGENLLKHIKSGSVLRRIPTVILGNVIDTDPISKCYKMGANCYITKPTDSESLKEVFTSLVRFWLQISLLPIEESMLL